MPGRFIAIWFQYLKTDWMIRRQPELKDLAFVFAAPERGRMMIKAASPAARSQGIHPNMVVADCKMTLPGLQVFDDDPSLSYRLLKAIGEWLLRYSPVIAVDGEDGIIIDISGCAHLWGGERTYLKDILTKLRGFGYQVRAAIADTIGTAWAISRYGQITAIIPPSKQLEALLPLPAAALRLDTIVIERLRKLGLHKIERFIRMPRAALRRRFGTDILLRLDQALGQEIEVIEPIRPQEPYQERLPSFEPIRTAAGIEIAIKKTIGSIMQSIK